MSIQLLNISHPTTFNYYSKLYNIYRDLYEIDLYGLEISQIENHLADRLKDKFLEGHEICYLKKSLNGSMSDFLAIGTYSAIKEISKNKISLIDEGLGQKISTIIANYSNYCIGTINVGNKELYLNKSYVMGILNVTPDSFSDGGNFINIDDAVNHALNMLSDGADIIDIGGESTRPGADSVSAEEEIKRVVPVINRILNDKPETIISIDTTKSEVVEEAIAAGAIIVNDISAGTFDKKIFEIVKKTNSSIILMHIKGTPKDMQDNPSYDDAVKEVYDFLTERVKAAEEFGIKNIIIDPGIGFGKRVSDNFELIRRLDEFRSIGYPILVGLSKKSFIGKSLNLDVNNRENATIIAETVAINKGARIIRTHNVKKAVEAREMVKFLNHPEILNND